eukprot:TRINITY_DN20162_c0_g1_i1.p1 TRINITY_DN20162_c0_g1~~TRINITY_DN20162_c0_g1_i1.p1  ORF type:complete len:329 (-),score=40.52 TRINITY_DN20162_c0_g1_i1:375-1361(-)
MATVPLVGACCNVASILVKDKGSNLQSSFVSGALNRKLSPNLGHSVIRKVRLSTHGSSAVRAEFVSRDDRRSLGATSTSSSASTSGSDEDEEDHVRDEADDMADGVSYGQLCNDFECISSPQVERTARRLVRDIYELRESKRQLSIFASIVKYKDPMRSFTGMEKYRRLEYFKTALEKPSVALLEMTMRSTSELNVRWRVRGRARAAGAGDVVLIVTSKFVLNQISGQVTEHEEEWDLSSSSPPAAVYFLTSRLAFSIAQAGKDAPETIKKITDYFQAQDNEGSNIYPDPSGDPRKFFQYSNPDGELYQLAFFLALIYLLVEFVKVII